MARVFCAHYIEDIFLMPRDLEALDAIFLSLVSYEFS